MQDIVVDVLIADDGTGDALVEQAGVEQQEPIFFLGLHILPVDVHDVGEQLERIERDADGQRDLRDDLGEACQQLQVLQEEAGVFKEAENQQHQCDGDRQSGFALPVRSGSVGDIHTARPADKGHAQQEQDIFWPGPGVKHQGEGQHDDVLFPDARHKRLHNDVGGKEQKYE